MLTASAATIYTMPTSPSTVVLRNGRIRFTNTDTVLRSATAYAVPSGGAASTTNMFCPAISIPPNGILDVDVPQMAAGDFIQVLADSASKINAQPLDGLLQS